MAPPIISAMTNCVGIHCARVLVGSGVSIPTATQMLIDELELSYDEAERAVHAAYDSVESDSRWAPQPVTG